MEIKNDVKGLKEESKIYEREILNLLLEISKSFSTGDMTREKREENFKKIDELREKVRDISKIIDDIENSKYDSVYKVDNTDVKEEQISKNQNEFSLDNIECVSKEEITPEEDTKNTDDINEIHDNNDEENKEEKEVNTDITKEDLENIDKVIENMYSKDNVEEENNNMILEETEEEPQEEIEENKQQKEEGNINQIPVEDAIEKIDRLIKEAKELNNNVIKFPEEKVVRRNRNRGYEEEIEEDTDYIIPKGELNFDYTQDNYQNENLDDVVEPVPVLFGNRRAQNQMIVRKKSNGFSDKLKSLIYKIKLMLGGEDEE